MLSISGHGAVQQQRQEQQGSLDTEVVQASESSSITAPAEKEKPDDEGKEADGNEVEDNQQQVVPKENAQQTAEFVPGVDDYPDGGLRAWLNVAGAAAVTCATFGFVNTWGVFQSIYESGQLSDVSPSTISWIGSVQYSLVFFPGLIAGRLFDLGYFREAQAFWSIVHTVSIFIIPECKKYWHFILVQGILLGLASGFLFAPTMAVLTHWFKKRRSLAFGVVALGSSCGGTVFPIVVRRLQDEIGFAWALRVMGFFSLVLLSFANLTLRRRLPPVNVAGGLLNLRTFRSLAYSSYCASSFFAFLGIYAGLTYLDVDAISHGVSPDLSFYLISIANAASSAGRLASGIMGDRIGALNTLIPSTLFAAIMTYAWPFAHNLGTLIVIALLYGFASGTYVSLLVVPIAHMGDHGDVGRRTGMANTILAVGALAGPPTCGAIATAAGSYVPLGAFAGSMVVISCICMLVTKWAMTGHVFRGKV